jgi:hypothetical protein
MITPDGTIRILDFGLAKARDLLTLTETGVGMGTFAYMSPEQLSGDRVDARTDLWSLGAVLVEMLTGRAPPRGRSPAQAIRDRDAETEERGVRQPDEVPEAVVRMAEKLLRDDPAERYQSARELLADLRATERAPADDPMVAASLQNGSVSLRPHVERELPGVESPSRGGVPASRGLSRFTYPVIVLLVAALGATTFWFLKRERDRHWLVEEAIPRMEQQLGVADWESAFALALEVQARAPGSRELAEFWPRMSWRVTIRSEPAGAKVFRQAYARAGDRWEELGRTPLVDIRVPYGLSRLRLSSTAIAHSSARSAAVTSTGRS